MKTQLLWILGGLGLAAAASRSHAQQPCSVQAGFTFNMNSCGSQCGLGPWYSYFPYDRHFQVPAPVCHYPNWPATFPPPQATGTPASQPYQGGAPNRMSYAPMYPTGQWPMQTVGYQSNLYPYGMPGNTLDFGR